jgi:Protein of unknown function (DUF998)
MRQGRLRALALTAVIGSWLFTVVWLVAPLWQDHYHPLDQAVSEMGGGTANLPGVMNAAFVLWAVAIAAGAASLHASMPASRWRAVAVASLALAAAAMLVIAFAHVDCSAIASRACYDRFKAGDLSWQNYTHDWASVAFGALLAVSSLAIAGFLMKRGSWLALLPLVGGVLGIASTVRGLVVHPGFDPHSHYGTYQRIGLLVSAGWIELLGAAVLVQLEESKRRASSPAWPSAAPQTWSAGRPTQPSA